MISVSLLLLLSVIDVSSCNAQGTEHDRTAFAVNLNRVMGPAADVYADGKNYTMLKFHSQMFSPSTDKIIFRFDPKIRAEYFIREVGLEAWKETYKKVGFKSVCFNGMCYSYRDVKFLINKTKK
jgi:hypothetical protein